MNDRRHPLPWSIHSGTFRLGGKSHFANADEPYSLTLGRHSSMEAALSDDDLRQLRDQIDAILAAPFRVLVPNPCEHNEPWLAAAIRNRLDVMHARHPRFELAMLDVDAVESAPIDWAFDARVRVLFYATVAEMYADGGSRVLLAAGRGALELSRLAHETNLSVALIRAPEAVA